MSGDGVELGELTRALRDHAREPEDDGGATLARVEQSRLARARTTGGRRRLTRLVILPIAAVFVVLTAWASASGTLSRWLAPRSPEESERAAREIASSTGPTASIIATATASEPPAASSEPPTERAPAPSTTAMRVDADALYRDAHVIHFTKKDYAAAVPAWDRYLAAAGSSGRFTLEARYNRAIALTRLGRNAEAATALRPFANGDYGGYRREQAQELLRTLE